MVVVVVVMVMGFLPGPLSRNMVARLERKRGLNQVVLYFKKIGEGKTCNESPFVDNRR